ncbi:MAG: IS5 family transposase [Candidatus Omnitrophica bacterium]|nr:IS5 family transposase [Candidatus Omnitrophota bacterium]
MDLTNEQWEVLEPLIPENPRRADGRGRPWKNNRDVLNGILWVLRTGAPWKDLPDRYPPYQTCHRRFQRWSDEGVMEKILLALSEHLKERGKLNLSEAFIDGSFSGAKKGGFRVGKTKRGKGSKIMAITDGNGLPLSASVQDASPHEVTLVEETLLETFLPENPERLIGDRAYDSDELARRLDRYWGINLIAPHRSNRKNKTQDGRELRRYKRRWKVERLFAWLHNFRRLVVRYEYHSQNFQAFVHLGCIMILLRYL